MQRLRTARTGCFQRRSPLNSCVSACKYVQDNTLLQAGRCSVQLGDTCAVCRMRRCGHRPGWPIIGSAPRSAADRSAPWSAFSTKSRGRAASLRQRRSCKTRIVPAWPVRHRDSRFKRHLPSGTSSCGGNQAEHRPRSSLASHTEAALSLFSLLCFRQHAFSQRRCRQPSPPPLLEKVPAARAANAHMRQ